MYFKPHTEPGHAAPWRPRYVGARLRWSEPYHIFWPMGRGVLGPLWPGVATPAVVQLNRTALHRIYSGSPERSAFADPKHRLRHSESSAGPRYNGGNEPTRA